jgi:hypothetical protein
MCGTLVWVAVDLHKRTFKTYTVVRKVTRAKAWGYKSTCDTCFQDENHTDCDSTDSTPESQEEKG